MTEKELRILMILTGVTQVSIARLCKVPRSYVNQVIKGVRTFPEIRQTIADEVGRPIEELWPPKAAPNNNDRQVNNHTKKFSARQGRNSR